MKRLLKDFLAIGVAASFVLNGKNDDSAKKADQTAAVKTGE